MPPGSAGGVRSTTPTDAITSARTSSTTAAIVAGSGPLTRAAICSISCGSDHSAWRVSTASSTSSTVGRDTSTLSAGWRVPMRASGRHRRVRPHGPATDREVSMSGARRRREPPSPTRQPTRTNPTCHDGTASPGSAGRRRADPPPAAATRRTRNARRADRPANAGAPPRRARTDGQHRRPEATSIRRQPGRRARRIDRRG